MRLFTSKTVIAALLGMMGTSALAQLPAPIKPGHPRLFATAASFVNVKAQVPSGPAAFPATGGSIQFDIKPSNVKSPGDILDRPIFGSFDGGRNAIVIRHIDTYDSANIAGFQVILQRKDGVYITASEMKLPAGAWSTVKLIWNSKTHFVDLKVDGVSLPTMWRVEKDGARSEWSADQQRFSLSGRIGDEIKNFVLKDTAQNELSNYASFDLPFSTAYTDFIRAAREAKVKLAACPTTATPAAEPKICNVATEHRILVYETAQQLALAYRLSGDQEFLDGAVDYINKMEIVARREGNAYTMGGRVAAMGILYDWLFDEMGKKLVPGDPAGRTYRKRLADTIKETIATTSASRIDDLDSTICGVQQSPLSTSGGTFNCAVEPALQRPGTNVPSIAWSYIAGMPFSGVNTIALSLLAIAEEQPEVLPLLETAYKHLDQGFLKARSIISSNGGNHAGYAYGMANLPERVLLWRSALQDSNPPVFQAPWQSQLIYPYIYGLRGDKTFPSSGDAFDITPGDAQIGNLALWPASNAEDKEGHALSFYKNQIATQPRAGVVTVLERLMYPVANTNISAPELPLSRHFSKAGQVLMRDSWDYPNATLLEFKSASLWSENHQHLEQNGLTLFYKAPLLLDSGQYDSYLSSHWANYYTRSIAHNTIVVFDPDERFMQGEREFSNDGGQWYRNPNTRYPTIEDMQKGGPNYLDGVTHYAHTPTYTFTVGNASKAYSDAKMKQTDGFVRSVLFLPTSKFWSKPVTVVFDAVRTERNLPATFLLHTANEPVASVEATSSSDDNERGLYTFGFTGNANRILTIRNGKGMLTAQTIAPAGAKVVKIGGKNMPGVSCDQMDVVSGKFTALVRNGDCRFSVRERQANGKFILRNYVNGESSNKNTMDHGAWRLEVSAATAPVNGQAQYFLHVLGVGDNKDGDTGPADAPAAMHLDSEDNTEAVLLGRDTVVSFNRSSTPATKAGWTAPTENPSIIATGLVPNAHFTLSTQAAANGRYAMTLQQVPTASGASYSSSAEGVVSIR